MTRFALLFLLLASGGWADGIVVTEPSSGGSGDFLADGTVPMTGNLDLDGNDLLMGGGNAGSDTERIGNAHFGDNSHLYFNGTTEYLEYDSGAYGGTLTNDGALGSSHLFLDMENGIINAAQVSSTVGAIAGGTLSGTTLSLSGNILNDLTPNIDNLYDLGGFSNVWKLCYFEDVYVEDVVQPKGGFTDTDLGVSNGGFRHLYLRDDKTAPGTPSTAVAVIYIDSADSDLKIKYDDGTVVTIGDKP